MFLPFSTVLPKFNLLPSGRSHVRLYDDTIILAFTPCVITCSPARSRSPVPRPPRRGQWHLHGHDNIQLYAEIVKERRYETESERDEALDAVAGESRRLVEIVLDKALFGVLDQPGEESDHA